MPWVDWRWCAEVEKFPSAVLAAHHGHPNLGDITAPDFIERAQAYGPLDLLVAGTPCQAFSVAGLRRSLEDARGNLTLRFVEIVNAIEPRFTLWENVPGVLSTGDNAFGCFLAGMVGADSVLIPARGQRWTDAGMVDGPKGRAAWRVLDAEYFGLAQRRERVFVVRCPRNGADPAEVLFEREGVQRHSAPRREAREGITGDVEAGARIRGAEIGPSGGAYIETAPTLDARCKDGPIRNQIGTVAMCLNGGAMRRIDAESETLIPAVAPTLRAGGNRTGGDRPLGTDVDPCESLIAHTLRGEGHDASEDGTGRGVPLVPMAFSCKDHGTDAGEIAPTLRAMPHDGSHANVGGQLAVAMNLRGRDGGAQPELSDVASLRSPSGGSSRSYAIQERAVSEGKSGPDGVGVREEVAYTLEARNKVQGVALNWMVRRLLPEECEKLQGFEPGYTQVEYRGKEAADGPRYKALGNSMAVPVIRFIGTRILEATR